MQVIAATGNRHKLQEFERIFAPLGIEIAAQSDVCPALAVEETGETFAENAFFKAQAVHRLTGKAAVADDSGLCVDALGGAPGVRSARYAGEGRNSSDNVALLLENLSGQADRKARFRTVIALIFGGKEYQFDGVVDGTITDTPHGGVGFGYDPVFVPDGYDVTFAEMDSEAKNAISHRGRAVEKLAAFLSGAK